MINDELKDRLINTLKSSVNHYNSGMSSTEAVTKAASDAKLNIDQTERLVEMFNTAKTIHHFNKHAKDDQKAASFELCDGNQVVLSLFDKLPDGAKITVVPRKPVDFTERDYSFYNKAAQDGLLNVTVINGISGNETPIDHSVDGLSIDNQMSRANKVIHDTRDVAKHAASISAQLQETASANLMKAADTLRRNYDDVASAKLTRLAAIIKSDDTLKNVIDKFASFIPSYLKAAFDNPVTSPVVDDSDLKEYLCLIKEASRCLRESDSLDQEQGTLTKAANSFEKDMYDAISEKEKEGSVLDCFFIDKGAQAPEDKGSKPKQPSLVNPQDVASTLYKPLGGIEQGISELIQYPDIEASNKLVSRLKDTHRSIILEDLIVTDPVISDVDPNIVAKAYKNIIQTAPEISLNKEVVRAILRSSVHSLAVSPFDANTWLNLEKTTKELGGTMPAQKQIRMENKRV